MDALERCRPAHVLDIGANTGTYSLMAAETGAKVVALDSDAAAIEALWEMAARENLAITALVANIARPTPAAGWRNREQLSLLDRLTGKFDLVLMLAVIHHLILREQLPLEHIAELCSSLTRRWLLVEWVPPSDPMYQEWLRGRDELYGQLSEDDLKSAFLPFFAVARAALGNGRVLLLLFARVQRMSSTATEHNCGSAAARHEPGMMKRIAQAWGFAAIVLLPNYIDLTSSTGDARMRFPSPLTRIALAQLADLLIVALIFAGLMAILRKLKSWPTTRWVLVAMMPMFLLVRNLNVFPFDVPNFAVLAVSVIWIAIVAFLMLRSPTIASRLYRGRRRAHRVCHLCNGDDVSTGARCTLAAGTAGVRNTHPRAAGRQAAPGMDSLRRARLQAHI